MTADEFRDLALNLPEASESAHMNHPDFRVRGRIFATLGHPADGWGMVKLTPAQQEDFVAREPRVFQPVPGGWGQQGATHVRLAIAGATEHVVRPALIAAWRNAAPKRLARELEDQ
jgi:hypothetical protein